MLVHGDFQGRLHSNDGDVILGPQVRNCGTGGGVACYDNGFAARLHKLCADGIRQVPDGVFVFGAIGVVGAVSEVDQVFGRQFFMYFMQDADAAQSGIEESNGVLLSVSGSHRVYCTTGLKDGTGCKKQRAETLCVRYSSTFGDTVRLSLTPVVCCHCLRVKSLRYCLTTQANHSGIQSNGGMSESTTLEYAPFICLLDEVPAQ